MSLSAEEQRMESPNSEELKLNDDSHNESFGDLEENSYMQAEVGQKIVLDDDPIDTNQELIQKLPNMIPSKQQIQLPTPQTNEQEGRKDSFYDRVFKKLEELGMNDQQIQNSYDQFQEKEQKYLDKIKIIYSHFLMANQSLSRTHYKQLRASLYVPKYGQELVKWGNAKYGNNLTLTAALERLDHLQLMAVPKGAQRCKQDLRVLGLIFLILLLIKLLF